MCGVCVAPDGGGTGGSKDETAPGKRLVRLGNMRVGVERAADFVLLAAFGVPRSEGSTAARNPHDSPSSHFPFIYRSVVNIASGAVLGLFSGFVLARTSLLPSPPFLLPPSFLFLFPPTHPSSLPTNTPSFVSPHPSLYSFLVSNTGTGHGRSLVAAMGVGCGVGASWVRCAQDFEEEKKK